MFIVSVNVVQFFDDDDATCQHSNQRPTNKCKCSHIRKCVNNNSVEVFPTPTDALMAAFTILVAEHNNKCIIKINNNQTVNNNQTEVKEIVSLDEHGLVDTVHDVKWLDIENSQRGDAAQTILTAWRRWPNNTNSVETLAKQY